MSLAMLLGSALFSEANVERVLSIRENFNMADMVLLAQIDGQEELNQGDEQCGIRYYATVLKWFKGKKDSDKIVFGRYVGLKSHKSYLLFLNYENDVAHAYEQMSKRFGFYDRRPNIMDLVACKGTVPGYVFDHQIQWEVVLGDVYLSGLLPEQLPSSIRVFQAGEGAVWMIPGDDLFPYLKTLGDHSGSK